MTENEEIYINFDDDTYRERSIYLGCVRKFRREILEFLRKTQQAESLDSLRYAYDFDKLYANVQESYGILCQKSKEFTEEINSIKGDLYE